MFFYLHVQNLHSTHDKKHVFPTRGGARLCNVPRMQSTAVNTLLLTPMRMGTDGWSDKTKKSAADLKSTQLVECTLLVSCRSAIDGKM